MRLWFSRGSEISIRDQLVTQVILSILSGDLKPGQRLPSTRELARRFHLHPNTISAGYRQLERDSWVEFRKGSGVYVREQKPQVASPAVALDQLIGDFFLSARKLDTPLSVVRSRLRQWLELQPPDHFLLIEPDRELASIIMAEIRQKLTFPVQTCVPEDGKASEFEGAIPVVLLMKSKSVRDLMPRNADLVTLRLRSAADSLAPYLPIPPSALVGIASRWPPFLTTARTMLIAGGFDADCLVVRDASKPNWRRGLNQTSAVICDSFTAQSLDGKPHVLTFPLLAESSLQELQEYEQFIRGPLAP